MLDMVKRLFEADVTGYWISRQSGVPRNTVHRLQSGETELKSATYKNIEALYQLALPHMVRYIPTKTEDDYEEGVGFWYEDTQGAVTDKLRFKSLADLDSYMINSGTVYYGDDDIFARIDTAKHDQSPVVDAIYTGDEYILYLHSFDTETGIREWTREGYRVIETEFDGDLHEFKIMRGADVLYTITPPNVEDMQAIIEDLDAGEDVNGWEDGNGNHISL